MTTAYQHEQAYTTGWQTLPSCTAETVLAGGFCLAVCDSDEKNEIKHLMQHINTRQF